MSFDYDTHTKNNYHSADKARHYFESYRNPTGLRGIRVMAVTNGERRAVAKLLDAIRGEVRSVIDVPCGTGKMAAVLKGHNPRILAGDISEAMMAYAKDEYRDAGLTDVSFRTLDVESLSSGMSERFDLCLCIRLLHRVPSEIRKRMLKEISEVAPYAIVSIGVDNWYQRARRAVSRIMLGGTKGQDREVVVQGGADEMELELLENHMILDWKYVVPVASGERVYLMKSRNLRDRPE